MSGFRKDGEGQTDGGYIVYIRRPRCVDAVSTLVISCPDCQTSYKAKADSFGSDGRTVRCARCGSTWFVPAPDIIDQLTANPDAVLSADGLSVGGLSAKDKGVADNLALADNVASETILSVSDDPIPGSNRPMAASARAETAGLASSVTPAAGVVSAVGTPELSSSSSVIRGADALIRDQADIAKLLRRRRTIRLIWLLVIIVLILAAVAAYWKRHDIVAAKNETATLYEVLGIEVSANGLKLEPPQARTLRIDGQTVIRIESAVRNLTNEVKEIPLIELTLHGTSAQPLLQWYVEPEATRIAARGRVVFTTEVTDPPDGVVGLLYDFAEEG